MIKFSKENQFGFPYLVDETQEIAKTYDAVCTPDFFGYNKDLELPVIEDSPVTNEESLKQNEEDEVSLIEVTKFGYDFISTSPTSITATGDLPLPNEYKISLSDVIGVVLSGSKEQIFDMKVQLDGTVLFPELGSVSVVGESFQDIKNKFKIPVISFIDTPGAYPGVGAEERGQAEAIAKSIECCMKLNVPTIAIIIGEGGSGGAIALASASKVLMLENAIYSVISPEGCATILWRDPKKMLDAATVSYTHLTLPTNREV